MYYYGLCTTRDLLTQFTMVSGFVYLCLKVSCSWGFQTVKYTADCTLWCIFNVKILQWTNNFFPHLLPFKGVLKAQLMNHVVYNRNCFFLLHNLIQSHHFLLSNADPGQRTSSSQGMFPLPRHFQRSCYNKGSSFLWNRDILTMMQEGKHILTFILHENKVDMLSWFWLR